MKTYRNLTCALAVLTLCSLALIVFFSVEHLGGPSPAVLNVNIAVFAVALVAFIVSFIIYFHSKNVAITVLKRRGSRVYGELLHHKMKLIDVMDDEKPLADWESVLYSPDEFPRIKKFLYEEYFLLLNYDPFLTGAAATAAVNVFYDMHKELENYMRSVAYDRIEYDKFKRLYRKVSGHDLAPDTPESDFERPELKEAYDALLSANEYALFNGDHLLKVLDAQLTELDRHFKAGVPWSTAKPSFDAEFQLWMNSKD